MKHFSVPGSAVFSPLVFVSAFHFCLAVSTASAADFGSLQNDILDNEIAIDALETEHGRYDLYLLEPLEQLAKIQLEANRFDDAELTINRAIQIARFSDGLFTTVQFPLLELEILISETRGDWDAVEAQLEHYVWLVANWSDTDRSQQLDRLDWIADKHLQCAFATTDEHRAMFLIRATSITEYAVQLAQVTRQTRSAIYAELLYGLSQKYYVETRGVLGDRASSYKLRVLDPNNPAVEAKVSALDRRYLAGLEKLVMLRDSIASSPEPSTEALGMAEIYIADWQRVFNNVPKGAAEYTTAINLLLDAGITEAQLESFFAQPAIIPREEFTLSFTEALAEMEMSRGAARSAVHDSRVGENAYAYSGSLSLREHTKELPGVVSELANARLDGDLAGDWQRVAFSLDFAPGENSSFRSRGFSMRSKAIPSAIRVADSATISPKELRNLLSRMKSIPFRPALRHGLPIPATIEVNYMYRDNTEPLISQWVTMR